MGLMISDFHQSIPKRTTTAYSPVSAISRFKSLQNAVSFFAQPQGIAFRAHTYRGHHPRSHQHRTRWTPPHTIFISCRTHIAHKPNAACGAKQQIIMMMMMLGGSCSSRSELPSDGAPGGEQSGRDGRRWINYIWVSSRSVVSSRIFSQQACNLCELIREFVNVFISNVDFIC